ncbi:phage baseplate assembly protein [Rhizobium sp. SL86]|uniref:phage baseplate assembly protein n=1 Tax=Rhizobium sp. SL86 TaxID=2995148 RepID=UPI00227388F7|nr:Mu P family protein [Rhizobium sp. SL86]MCY1668316.1 Mu P family protein [Rhizobium sp. SL86]
MAKSIRFFIEGTEHNQWLSCEVSRDLKDFSGAFSFTFRDGARSSLSLPFATAPLFSITGPLLKLRPGPTVTIKIGRRTVLKGWIDKVEPDIGDGQASVTISGRDVANDLIDCAAMADQAEYANVKLEDAVARIAKPYGLTVRSEIDTGEPFARYSIDLAETAFSAIEKGARSRHALVLSDGIGGIVITQTGKTRAPAALTLPGNVLRSRGTFDYSGRHSDTTVRGQSEGAAKARGEARLDATAEPIGAEDRQDGDGSATTRERRGIAATGRAVDDEITRHRPVVHLARSQADGTSTQAEAERRMRTARGESEEFTLTVKGHEVGGQLWTVNQLVEVSDAYLDVYRDLLISRVGWIEDYSGCVTDITVCSPEAFDAEPVGNRRTNRKGKKAGKTPATTTLDGTAEAL